MSQQEFSGRSAAEAAIKACEQLGVPRSALKYEVVSQTGDSIETRQTVISVQAPAEGAAVENPFEERGNESRADSGGGRGRDRDRDRGERSSRRPRDRDRDGDRDRGRGNRRRDSSRSQSADPGPGIEPLLDMNAFPRDESKARKELTTEPSERARLSRDLIEDLLSHAGFELDVRLVEDDEEVHFEMWGKDEELVIGPRCETLLAIQFLINRMVQRELDGDKHIVIDAGGYRQRRRSALSELAKKLAERATEEHKAVRLSPMSAHDRRVFHLTLEESAAVTTRSEGSGMYRPLLIIPAEQ